MKKEDYIKNCMRVVKDYPKKGVNYKDFTFLLKDPKALQYVIEIMEERLKSLEFDSLAGQDLPGIFGLILSSKIKKPFIMINKKGLLPGQMIGKKFKMEYGKDELELNPELVKKGEKVLIVGYLMATGGTAKAMEELIEKAGGEVVGYLYLIKQENFDPKLNKPLLSILKYKD